MTREETSSSEIHLETTTKETDVAVYVLPCHIAYNGPANVSQFFKPRVESSNEELTLANFRGRKLCGRTVQLPHNYSGTVCPG
jgi:ribonuclease H2 subunit C